MSAPRILFAHVPWRRQDEGGVVRRRIMAIPTGMFGLAALAVRRGFRTELVHVGLEEELEPRFRLERDGAVRDARVVAFDLHWHPQLGHVLEAARRVKDEHPGVLVLLGGMTASAFHAEIMQRCPWVDLVIRGEAEGPLAALLDELARETPRLDAVPNLSWRATDGVRENPLSWTATRHDLDAIELDVELLRHRERYTGAIEQPAPDGASDPLWGSPRTFHVVVGRGCTRNCGYCGGAKHAVLRAHGRSTVVLRSTAKVHAELRRLVDAGFHTLYFAFDPPGTSAWYLELFSDVAAAGALPSAVLEHYDGLPSDALLAAFARAFEAPTLVLSPGSALASLRARHGMQNPDNERFEDAIRRARSAGLDVLLYFTLLPGDTPETLRQTAGWMAELERRYGVRLQFATIEVEPGSGWVTSPSSFGLELERKSFEDFLRHHVSGQTNDLGYRVPDRDAIAQVVSEAILPLIAPRGGGGVRARARAR